MKKNIKPIKVALDSDMLRNLINFTEMTKRSYNLANNQHVASNIDEYIYLMGCYYEGLIEFRIGKTVYKENKHVQEILDFISKFNVESINVPEEQVKVMADAYCCSYFDVNKEKRAAPMMKKYVACLNQYLPSNDAYIMAEATIGNCYLLTNNSKDFISVGTNVKDHTRLDGIKCINKQFKFHKIRDGKIFIPQPINLTALVKYLKNYNPSKCYAPQISQDGEDNKKEQVSST